MQVSLFRNGISQTSEPENFEVLQILNSIKKPSTKLLEKKIKKLRSIENEDLQKEYKRTFPYVTFSGIFNIRNAKGLIKHSGLICIDFDDVENLKETFEQLKTETYIFAMFTSPRGNGLKVLIKILSEKHLESFLEIEKYFIQNYNLEADKSGKDVCRACFMTYDPDLYFNENSRLFNVEDFYKVDTDTGEITEIKQQTFAFAETEKKDYNVLEHCLMVTERIEASKKDIAFSYDDWLLVAFSLATLGEDGRSIFHRVSAMYPEYKYEEADKKFTNAISTTRFTSPGKFFTLCRENNIDISYYEKKGKKTIEKKKKTQEQAPPTDLSKPIEKMNLKERKALIKKMSEELDLLIPNTPEYIKKKKELSDAKALISDKPQNKAKSSPKNFTTGEDFKEGTDPSFEAELRRKLPEGVDVKDYMNYGFYEFKNCYFMSEKEGVDVVISNFIMKVKFLIKSKTEPKRLVEITNMYGYKAMVDMSIETMVSLSKFCQAVESEGNFLFEGKESHLKKIKRKLFMEEKTSEEIRFLGFQKELSVYAFANGIFDGERFHEIDQYGIVEHKEKNIYIPALSKINQHDDFSYENERKFVYKKSTIDFQEWAKLFYHTYQEKSIIAISFYVASVFRDVIFSQTRFFPILNLFGAPGTGKTTMAASLMFLFGDAQEPFMLGGAGTPKGFMRKFGQFYNSLIWLDEFKNSIDLKKMESLKNIYDGVGYEKALMTQDSKTKTSPIYSACLLSGEELPTGNEALFKRVIFIEFESSKFNELQKEAYQNLVSNQIKGISSLTTEILRHRGLFIEQFSEKFNNAIDYLTKETKKEGENLDDRIIKNYAVLLATLDIIFPHIKLHFTLDQAKSYFLERIIYQSDLINSSSKVSKFWDIVQFLYEMNQIVDEQDFKVVDNILFIRMTKIFPLYMDSHVRQFGERGLDKSSLTRYLERSKGFEGYVTSTWFGKANSSAHKFNLEKLPIKLTYIAKDRVEHTEEVYQPIDTPVPVQKDIFKKDSRENLPF